MWWAQTKNPIPARDRVAHSIPRCGGNDLASSFPSIHEIMPNAGRTIIYTSGWPKYQNRCCQIRGSPLEYAEYIHVFADLSVNNNVIAAPKTGSASINSTLVMNMHQLNNPCCVNDHPEYLEHNREQINVIEPPCDEIPNMCSTIITSCIQSDTEAPVSTSGGYRVHPAPNDSSLQIAIISSSIEITSSSKASKLSLGAPKSHAIVSCGSPQLPANDINRGIIKKKTIPIPCRETIMLYQPVPLKYIL